MTLFTVAGGCILVGIVFIVGGLYFYRAPNLTRLARRVPWMVYMVGVLFSLRFIGMSLFFFALFLLAPSLLALQLALFWAAVLIALLGIVFWFWQPTWIRPYWARDEDGPDN
jgi:hypothetical protein